MHTESRQLVFGDDRSAAADIVWSWIDNHSWAGWRISVVTAQPHPAGARTACAPSVPRLWNPPQPRQLFYARDATPVEHLMAEGDPRLVLDSFDDAALLAIGPRGTGLLKRLHIGSTAEWLVSADRPLVPLVVIRSERLTRQVLLCVDGSTHAQKAVETLAGLPWIRDTHITILGVTDGHDEVERGVDDAARLLESCGITNAQKRLTAAIPHTATFDVRSAILDTIAEDAPDLVVVGTRGVGGVRRAVLGSTASAVLHHSPCSVLVVRAPETDRD